MLIVIVIISILLSLSMRLSGDRIQILKTKSVQEQIAYNYNELFSKNMLTNYHDGVIYDQMIIRFELDSNNIMYHYGVMNSDDAFENDFLQWWKYKISKMSFGDNNVLKSVELRLAPYVLWCDIVSWDITGKILLLDFEINDREISCFQINSNLCKMEKIRCDG